MGGQQKRKGGAYEKGGRSELLSSLGKFRGGSRGDVVELFWTVRVAGRGEGGTITETGGREQGKRRGGLRGGSLSARSKRKKVAVVAHAAESIAWEKHELFLLAPPTL